MTGLPLGYKVVSERRVGNRVEMQIRLTRWRLALEVWRVLRQEGMTVSRNAESEERLRLVK